MFYSPDRQLFLLLSVSLFLMQSAVVRAADAQGQQHDGREGLHVLIDEGTVETAVGEVDREVTSSAYSVIEKERFRHTFVSLPEVLEQEVGVQLRSTGGEGSPATVVLRGISNEQVIIYLDGVPLNDASGGPVDLGLIPLNNIERIEVYRGSTPLALGSPSIGGAVNIITRRSVGRKDHRLSATVASFHTVKLSGASSISSKRDKLLFSASYLQSRNDFSFLNDNGTQYNPHDDRIEKRNNDGVRNLALLADWKRRFSSRYDTELRLDYYDRNKELPAANNSPQTQAMLDTRQLNLLGQLNAHSLWLDNFNANLKLFALDKNEIFDDSQAQLGFFNQHTESDNRKYGVQVYGELNRVQSQWKLLSGISRETYSRHSLQALVESGTSTRDRLELSLEGISYLDQQRFIANLILRYQVIHDGITSLTDEFGTVSGGFDKSYYLLNPQLGVKYRFDRRTYISANMGRYNRAPSFFELFGGEGLVIGNVDLKQEVSLNTDLGVTYTWFEPYSWLHDAELYGGIFHNEIENLIVRIYNGQGIAVPKNISDAVVQGLEMTLKLVPAGKHSINVNLSVIDSINRSPIASFQNKALPGYYRHNLAIRYGYTSGRWLYGVEMNIKRNMYYDRSNLLKGDDVNLFNFSLRRTYRYSSIDFRVDNILDENIRYFRNRPTPGLAVSLTFNHSF